MGGRGADGWWGAGEVEAGDQEEASSASGARTVAGQRCCRDQVDGIERQLHILPRTQWTSQRQPSLIFQRAAPPPPPPPHHPNPHSLKYLNEFDQPEVHIFQGAQACVCRPLGGGSLIAKDNSAGKMCSNPRCRLSVCPTSNLAPLPSPTHLSNSHSQDRGPGGTSTDPLYETQDRAHQT